MSSIDLLQEFSSDWSSNAVVYDDIGNACTEYALERVVTVTFVTRRAMVGQMLEGTARVDPALDRLVKDGRLRVVTRARIACASLAEATIKGHGSPEETVSANLVVFVGQKIPNSEIYDRLVDTGIVIHRVGDILAPRDLQVAIREGYLAGRLLA